MNKHKPFCRCNYCKQKRRSSIFYLWAILAFLIVICYQLLLLVFITTRLNAVILLIEFLAIWGLIFFIIF